MPLDTVGAVGGGNISPCHIHRLNDDCLIAIFYEVVRHPPRHLNHTVFSETDQLISITHICQRWRELALDLAELWAEVVFVYPKAFPTFLERARETPLSLTFLNKTNEEQTGYILSHPERFLALHFAKQSISFMSALAGRTWPILEILELDYSDEEPHFEYSERSVHAPLLKSAKFVNFYAPFVAPHLTILELHVDRQKSGEIDVEHFQILLKGLPLLEELSLDNCLPESGWEPVSEDLIELPYLARLNVTSSFSAIISVIETLDRINDYAHLYLTVFELEDEEDAAYLASMLRPYLESAPHDRISISGYYQDFEGGGDDTPSRTLSIWASDKKGRGDDSYQLDMDIASGPEDIMVIYKGFFEQLSEGQIQGLAIHHPYRYNEFNWGQTLPVFHLPQFTQSVRTMEYILEDCTEEEADFGSAILPMFLLCKPLAYTNLASVVIQGSEASYARATSPGEMNRFIRWLRARTASSMPLKSLVLNGKYGPSRRGDTGKRERPRDWEVWEEVKKFVQVVDGRD